MKASQGGMTEVELGKLAESNGSSADVKQFGSHMVMDHGKANDQLMSLAQQKNLTVSSSLDVKHQATVYKFKHMSGPAFDKAYVNEMVKDHKMDASLFRQESTSAQDPRPEELRRQHAYRGGKSSLGYQKHPEQDEIRVTEFSLSRAMMRCP